MKERCQRLTNRGLQCTRGALSDGRFCGQHELEHNPPPIPDEADDWGGDAPDWTLS